MKLLIIAAFAIGLLWIFSATEVQAKEVDWLWIEKGGFIDNSLVYGSTGLILADLGTTLDIRRHDNLYEENNSIQGSGELKRSDIIQYFAIKLGVHYFVNTNVYTRPWANFYNMFTIRVTGKAVKKNIELGLSVNFLK